MADELRIALDMSDTGLTLLGKVFSASAQVGSNVAMTEIGSTAVYVGSFSLAAVSDGHYMVRFDTASSTYGFGQLYVRNNLEVSQEEFEKKSEADTWQTALITEIDANETKIDLLETKAQADTRQTALIAEHDATQASIAALNDFDPASDTVAHVTLVDTTTTNTDMRGTDNAALASTLAASDVQIAAIKERTDNLPDLPASKFDAIVGANA